MHQFHYRSCTLCEAMCGLQIETSAGSILGFKGDPEDKFSRGHICPKGPELKSLYQDPDRIKFPQKRTKSGWETVSWVEALSDIAVQLVKIQTKYGNDSVAIYNGNPTVHNYGSMLFGQRFSSRLKTKNNFSATSVDQLPHQLLSYLMFGHQLLVPIPDIDHTDFFLILGGNPFASNGSLMSVPDVKKRLKAIQDKGGKYVVVDPRKSETASHANEHIFIKPGTDAYFLLALLHVLFANKLTKANPLIRNEDLQTIEDITKEYDPERVSKITGVPTETIQKIATEFAKAESAVCYGRVGVSTQEFGAVCQWLINVINIVTGNLDKKGGAMFTLPAIDLVGEGSVMRSNPGSFNSYQSRVRKLPEFSDELPVAALAEEILTEGEGKIHALVTSAGNPVLSTPNGTKLDSALSSLEFMVCVDFYLNETTKHANYILPPTSALEHDHYDLIFNVFAVRNTARYNEPLFAPEPGMLHDWEIFSDLTKRLELTRSGKELPKEVIKTKLTPASIIDHALKSGPYGNKGTRAMDMSLELLKNSPHGVDLGPLQPSFPERLYTEDKKIQLFPKLLKEDLPRLKSKFSEWENFSADRSQFLLIGRRHLRSNNSWMHNLPKLMTGKSRCTIMIHPDDAGILGISNEEEVIVESSVGKIRIPAEITEELMKGVVSIPHGFGHNRGGTNQKVATEFSGVSINDLTDDQSIDEFSGNAAFSGVKVFIKKQKV
ncbi:molybdopterin-dependent oxidoreductase [Leptospira kanakyensis]|uniref:Molybdopterin oxidoreductase family protein n=1 Tax=Leptospira kanakyensis TaxID=2484968 RepID=A0A6N4QPX5_9LEPT|nr:molybdopterin-dependent oxidoreductase [Leptospira kanakyensis]MCW7482834.1 molybdopterin-dependent oxidoreductase [Leptospira kanakyensis]TGK55527.1 molybdopterin oxidoreductase family protein [Leptospira kanakyensis]TGK61063.1 molybdopterin oxidoreductase family protein [Leptospira kanakyensis]TGK76465.1 molybdopterin oxidoreductase family protein [Leptospira kanakyensis]